MRLSLELSTPTGTVSKPAHGRLAAILAVLLAVSCLAESVTTESGTASRLHRWCAEPRAVGLGDLRTERRPLLRIELRVLLLGIEVGHR